jgi:hypothetical protein
MKYVLSELIQFSNKICGAFGLFGNITDMISQWEGMEGKEERVGGDLLLNKRGRKRLSNVIRKLSGQFEERESHISQLDVMCGGEGNILSFSSNKVSNSVKWEESKIRRKNTASKATYQSSNSMKVSTNRNSQKYEPTSILCGTNQSGDMDRKRKAFWRDNPVAKKSKMEMGQLGT